MENRDSIYCEVRNGRHLCDVAAFMDRMERVGLDTDGSEFVDLLQKNGTDKSLAEHIAKKFWNETGQDLIRLYNDLDIQNKAALIRAIISSKSFSGESYVKEVEEEL